MKKLLLIALTTFSINVNAQWFNQVSDTTDNLQSVYFADTAIGYVVGGTALANGTILKTTNGGINWIGQTSGTVNKLYSVQFISADTGYTSGLAGTVLKTTDGGINWQSCSITTTNNIYSMFFVNSRTGFAVGIDEVGTTYGAIYKTIDRGTTWTQQTIPDSTSLISIYFTDSLNGCAVGFNGKVITTTDGGTNWIAQTDVPSSALFKVYFANTNIGYALGAYGEAFKTIDAGVTWSVIHSFTSMVHLSSLYFTSVDTGFITTNQSGYIFKTTDGGITWHNECWCGYALNSIYFPSANIGYAVGDNGTIHKSTNAGEGFLGVTENTNANEISIYPNPTNGLFTIHTKGIKIKEIIITNVLGEELKRIDTQQKTMSNSLTINLTGITKGVYFVQTTDEQKRISNNKIIIQ